MVKVSVLVPIYNVEKYLDECVNSIINQTLKDIEIILLDDGSKDNSGKICDYFAQKDSRVKVIHKDNSGYGATLNVGLKLAVGDYISIVESDDFIHLSMLEKLLISAETNNADVVKSNFYLHYSNENKNVFFNNFKFVVANQVTNSLEQPEILETSPAIWSGVYKRKFLLDNNIVFNETPGASYQDVSFAAKTLAKAEKFVILPEAFVYYRQDNENSSVKSKGKVDAIFNEYAEIKRYFNNYSVPINYFQNIFIKQYRDYIDNFHRIANEYKSQYLNMFQRDFTELYSLGVIKDDFFAKHSFDDFHLLLKNPEKYKQTCLSGKTNIKFIQKIFSVLNENDRKVVRVLGFKISFKGKNKASHKNVKNPNIISVKYHKKSDYLSISSKKGFESRVRNTIYMFVTAFNAVRDQIKNSFSISIDTDDYSSNTQGICFSYSNDKNKTAILMPDYIFLSWPEIGVENYNETCKKIELRGQQDYKYDKLLWIGNVLTHESRQVLMNMYANNQKFDLYGMSWEKSAEKLMPTKYISLQDHADYKYLLNIRGRGYSGRVKFLLFSNRPLFYVERECDEFFTKDLKPFVHYIPVKSDLSDLEEKFNWAENNYEQAKLIAHNALVYAKENLTTEAAIKAFSDILIGAINKK